MPTVLGKRARASTHGEDLSRYTRSRKYVKVLEDHEDISDHELTTQSKGSKRLNPISCSNQRKRTSSVGNARISSQTVLLHDENASDAENDPLADRLPAEECRLNRNIKALKGSPDLRHPLRVGHLSSKQLASDPTEPFKLKQRTVFTEAQQIFTVGTNTTGIIEREYERSELTTFVSTRAKAGVGGCIYVSGPPGTGKSALVSEVCHDSCSEGVLKYASVNCMSVRSAEGMISAVLAGFQMSGETSERRLDQMFSRDSKQSYLVVLDEIDSLVSIDLEILYRFFRWALAPRTNLILIGIANALDLTDRFLPKLKAQNLKPQLLPFLPYTVPQITSILTTKCRSLLSAASNVSSDYTPILQPSAIQLISKKVASQTGDIRKAFELARRVIRVLETETQALQAVQVKEGLECTSTRSDRSPLNENNNLSSPSRRASTSTLSGESVPTKSKICILELHPETAPRATPVHVVRASSTTTGSSLVQRLKDLNFQQKAMLCILARLERDSQLGSPNFPPLIARVHTQLTPSKRRRQCAVTIRAIMKAYSSISSRENYLHNISQTELRDIMSSLEITSVISLEDGTNGLLVSPTNPFRSARGRNQGPSIGDERRVSARFGMQELECAIDGIGGPVLKDILYGYSQH